MVTGSSSAERRLREQHGAAVPVRRGRPRSSGPARASSAGRVDRPERPPAGPSRRLELVGDLGAEAGEQLDVLVGPSRRAGRRRVAVEHGLVQAVDGVVEGRAPVERGDRHDVLGLVDRSNPEQVAHEVGVRARRPRLDAGGRDRRVERCDRRSVDRSPSYSVNASPARASRRRTARASTSSVREERVVADVAAGAAPGPQLAHAVLGRRHRELGGRQPVDVGVDHPHRRGPVAVGARGREPARRVVDGRGPQVAPRDGDEDPAGVVVTAARNWRWATRGPLGGARQPGGLPLVVAEQRVDGRRRREQALDRPEDDDEVDVEAARSGEEADVDAVADRAAAGRRDVELGDERRAELGAIDGRADRVEVAQPVEDPLGALVGLLLVAVEPGERQPRPNQRFELLVGPARPIRPRTRRGSGRRGGARRSPTKASNASAVVGGGRAALAGLGDVAAAAGRPSPRRGRSRPGDRCAPSGPSAPGGRRRRGRARRRAAPSGRSDATRGGRGRAARRARRGTTRSPVPVPGRPFHGISAAVEMVLDEPGVRMVDRPQHRHAVERHPGAGAVEDRCARPTRTSSSASVVETTSMTPAARTGGAATAGAAPVSSWTRSTTDGVGRGVTGEPDDELDVAGLAERAEQVDLERAEPLGEVHHRPADSRAGRSVRALMAARARRSPSSYHAGREQLGELGGHPGGLAAAAGAGERGERGGTGERGARGRGRAGRRPWRGGRRRRGRGRATARSTCLTARSTTGVDTGLRPSSSSDDDPSSSARRKDGEDVDGGRPRRAGRAPVAP